MKRFILIALVSVAICPLTRAQDSVLPPVVQNGLKALVEKGASEAVAIWLKGTPAEKDGKLTTQLLDFLQPMIINMGNVNGYEVIRTVQVSPSVVTSYVVIKLDKGAIYMIADSYQAQTGWIINNIRIDGDMRAIFTEDFIIDLYDQAQKK